MNKQQFIAKRKKEFEQMLLDIHGVKGTVSIYLNQANPQIKQTLDSITKETAKYFDLPLELVRSKRKKTELVNARMIAIVLYFESDPILTLARIGEYFGGRDHATIIHARDNGSEWIKSKPEAMKAYLEIKKRLF